MFLASGVWSIREQFKSKTDSIWPIFSTYLFNIVYARNTTNSVDLVFTLPANWREGDLAIASGFWDNGSLSSVTMTGWTEIVNNVDGTEYPEGSSFYRILQSGDSSTQTMTCNSTDTSAGVMMVFRLNRSISSISIGNTNYSDGASALNSSISADSPTVVADNTIRLKGYALTGRPLAASIQDSVPSFTQSGWIWTNGDAVDYIDCAYKILNIGTTDVSEQVTTTDAGRQAHHLFSLTIS
jgi:hypothetical protein